MSDTKSTQYKIREAQIEDAARLVEIYSHYITDTAVSFEYEVPSVDEFKSRITKIKQKYPYVNAGILYDSERLCLEFSQKYPVNALHPYVEMLDVHDIRKKTDLPIRVWNEEEIFYPGKEPCKHYDFEMLEKLGVTDIFTNIADYYTAQK